MIMLLLWKCTRAAAPPADTNGRRAHVPPITPLLDTQRIIIIYYYYSRAHVVPGRLPVEPIIGPWTNTTFRPRFTVRRYKERTFFLSCRGGARTYLRAFGSDAASQDRTQDSIEALFTAKLIWGEENCLAPSLASISKERRID